MNDGLRFEDLTSPLPLTEVNFGVGPQLSAGQMLKQARINSGLHVAALAVTLKVPVKRLEALEDDNMTLLPDVVFVRALASSVCRTLKVDPTPILEKLPKASLPRLNSQHGLSNMPLRTATSAGKTKLSEALYAPSVIGVLLLLLAAAAIYLWPKSLSIVSLENPAAMSLFPNGVDLRVVKDVNATKLLAPGAVKVNEATVMAPPDIPQELVQTADNQASINSKASSPDSFALIATNSAVPANSIVVFKATGQTWVEVKSVNGITILKKLLNNGEVAGATGTLPLTVIVGRADVTQVEVRGKQVDLGLIAKSNVARFEVN